MFAHTFAHNHTHLQALVGDPDKKKKQCAMSASAALPWGGNDDGNSNSVDAQLVAMLVDEEGTSI
jgi:hypothetical protein